MLFLRKRRPAQSIDSPLCIVKATWTLRGRVSVPGSTPTLIFLDRWIEYRYGMVWYGIGLLFICPRQMLPSSDISSCGFATGEAEISKVVYPEVWPQMLRFFWPLRVFCRLYRCVRFMFLSAYICINWSCNGVVTISRLECLSAHSKQWNIVTTMTQLYYNLDLWHFL